MSLRPEHTDERSNRLARVRENQRKSRARKQQYIEELEQKVAVCNAQAQQREIEHLIAIQKLEAENAKLRSLLLHRVGITPDFLEDFLKDESHRTAAAGEKIAIPRLKASPSQTPATTNTAKSCSPQLSKSVDGSCAQIPNCQSGSCREPSEVMSVEPTAIQHQTNQSAKMPSIASLCDCGPESTTKWPKSDSSADTTLCEVAQDLIDVYNIRGVDINIIKQRLWPGFRDGDSAGCRVRNNLLFEILDELSGDISASVSS
ncbi:hypothetical protein UA08_04163 [Talaromyces atroroseus]|uniref:BZIP domain-containing protein n=1 Tax=Talaromyces atroroseus TaxID=1441469 RepID=A0A1Q5Q9K0_TALAT|nr:hypothetical protein UA08_04163 [Talaromyces atroroseus]OKL60630.1 hypothetical protein UA08_04163 [Talaromyces atroroseus]